MTSPEHRQRNSKATRREFEHGFAQCKASIYRPCLPLHFYCPAVLGRGTSRYVNRIFTEEVNNNATGVKLERNETRWVIKRERIEREKKRYMSTKFPCIEPELGSSSDIRRLLGRTSRLPYMLVITLEADCIASLSWNTQLQDGERRGTLHTCEREALSGDGKEIDVARGSRHVVVCVLWSTK